MDYNLLKYIVTVDKHQSISKAAEELFLTQPNISKAIQLLEKETGFQIFIRTSRGVSTTIEGKEFIKKANKILKSFEDFTKEFSNTNANPFTMNIAHYRDIYFQNKLLEFVPYVTNINHTNINILEGNTDEIIEMILKERVNLGIICINIHDLAYYKKLLLLNNCDFEIKSKLQLKVTLHSSNPLSKKSLLTKFDLEDQTLITTNTNDFYRYYHDKYQITSNNKFIKMNVSFNQLAMLEKTTNSCLLSFPLPIEKLNQFNCKMIDFDNSIGDWIIIAIHKKNIQLTESELKFIETL